MKKLKIEHSSFTKFSKISYSEDDAMQYLYFNGDLPVDCSQNKFIEQNTPNTICNHIRMIHSLTWFRNEILLECILYAISDSKSSVDLLRNKKNDPYFDIGWWRMSQNKVFKEGDAKDEFYKSNAFRRQSNCLNAKTELIAHKIINENEEKSPLIYKKYYKRMLNEILNLEDKELAFKLKKIVLTCVYMRYRIDQRIIYHEKNQYSGNFIRFFFNRYVVVFFKKIMDISYYLLVKTNNLLKQLFS